MQVTIDPEVEAQLITQSLKELYSEIMAGELEEGGWDEEYIKDLKKSSKKLLTWFGLDGRDFTRDDNGKVSVIL